MIVTIDARDDRARIRVLGVPLKLSRTPGAMRTPPPTLGQHTDSGAAAAIWA